MWFLGLCSCTRLHKPTCVCLCVHVFVWVWTRVCACATAPPRWQGVSIMINRQTRQLSHAITLHYGSQDFKVKMNGSSSTWRLHISSFFSLLFLSLLFFGGDLSLFSQPPFVVRITCVFVTVWNAWWDTWIWKNNLFHPSYVIMEFKTGNFQVFTQTLESLLKKLFRNWTSFSTYFQWMVEGTNTLKQAQHLIKILYHLLMFRQKKLYLQFSRNMGIPVESLLWPPVEYKSFRYSFNFVYQFTCISALLNF